MTLKMDKSGRIGLPKRLRERLGIKPDMGLEAVEEASGVLLRLVEQEPCMVQVDGLWVHQRTSTPDAHWGRVLDDARDERTRSVLKA
jgi:bifunctional DNA-binding transcriptional regulator/antitoxin component of YhaV-PrlF toxin-antitoxin module